MTVGRTFGAIYVPIDAVQEHPRNFRDHDAGIIAHSIGRFGEWRALVVQESTGFVLVGNGQLKAHRIRGDVEVPVLYRDVDDETALAILLADNWLARRGRDMPAELLDVMRELAADRELFEATGADDADLDELERDVADLDKPLSLAGPKRKPIVCPACGETWTPKGARR